MSCSPFDLRDYVLKELPEAERKQAEAHVKGCAACRGEVERLRMTEAALFSLRDEEIPQRIAFVSDKIFEPSPWRRGWAAFWGSTARLGFASAAMLSVALIVFSLTRAAGNPAVPLTARVLSPAAVAPASISEAEMGQRIQSAVDQAVAVSAARLEKSFQQQITEMQKRNQASLLIAAGELDWMDRERRMVARSSYGPPLANSGEVK
ncbi:MAG: zf-HC2 domain-containing protein [Acidobacteriia bacterium]|nr:zf-HC2 domain-containing protein [Terriglobia bacterium]